MAATRHAPRSAPRLALRYAYGGLVHYRAGDSIAPRVLPDYELVLIIEGRVVYEADGRRYPAMPGSVVLARPDFRESYRWDPDALTRHAYFHFDIAALPADWPAPSRWPVHFARPPAAALPLVRHAVERLAAEPESASGPPGPDLCCVIECILRLLLHPVAAPGLATETLPEPVMHALNCMRLTLDDDPHHALTLAEVARRSGVSAKHLCQLFSDALGYPPMKTLQLLRLQRGVALLGQSNLSVQEIADRCGFANPLYFSRCFSATYGQSPSAARHAMRAGQPPPASPLPPDITPRIFW